MATLVFLMAGALSRQRGNGTLEKKIKDWQKLSLFETEEACPVGVAQWLRVSL